MTKTGFSMLTVAIPFSVWTVLAGCSVPQRVLTTAELLAAQTERVQQDAGTFARQREVLARARLHNMALLEQATRRLERNVQARNLDRWAITGDEERLDLYLSLVEALDRVEQAAAEDAALQVQRSSEIAAVRTGVAVRSKALTATAKALAELSTKPSQRDQLASLISFLGSVATSNQEAAGAGQAAVEAGNAKASHKTDDIHAAAQRAAAQQAETPEGDAPVDDPSR